MDYQRPGKRALRCLARSLHRRRSKIVPVVSGFETLNRCCIVRRQTSRFLFYRNEVVMKVVRITIVIVVIALIMAFAAVAVGYLK